MDIASLGIQINTSDVQKAETDLDKLARAGANAEQSAGKVGTAWQQAGDKMGKASTPAAQVAASFKQGSEAIKAQQAELSALIGRIDPVVGALGRLDQMEEQLRKHNAAGLLGKEDFSVYSSKIDAMRRSLSAANDDLGKTGVSAKQTAAALRLVPAQFTDIATSLAGGQSPLTVLLQQGGQLKDAFGGAGPAAQALGGYVAGLVNPFTAAAAAVAVLALAYKQGSDESTAYTRALILSGNATGTNADALASMAQSVGDTTTTTGAAADALTQLAGTGKIAEAQLSSLAAAAVSFGEVTGKAVSETVAEFAKLADDPVGASESLNRQYNYLTAAVYEQIQALQEQGDKQGAAALAEETYASALKTRAEEIKASLGTLESAWNAIALAGKQAWDSMLAVGRDQTIDEKIAELKSRLAEINDTGSAGPKGRAAYQLGAGKGGDKAGIQQELTAAELQKEQGSGESRQKAALAKANKDAIDAQRQVSALRESMLTKAEQKEKAIADYWANVSKVRLANPFTSMFSQAQIDKDLANISDKYAEKVAKPKKAPIEKAYQDDAATKMLQSLREQGAALDSQLTVTGRLTTAQQEQVKFEQLIADLKTKSILTADQKSLLANQDAITAQLAKNAALSEEVKSRGEITKLQERSAQLQSSITEAQASRRDQQSGELDAFGKGKEELQRVKEQASIRKEYARYQRQLDAATPKDALGSAEYREASAKIKAQLDVSLKDQEAYYDALDNKRADSNNGADAAFADYIANAKDAAGQTYDLFSSAFQGMEDALVEFAMTGKLSFSDLANSIMADLIRIEIKKAMVWAVGGDTSGSGVGSVLSAGASALGAYFGSGSTGSATYTGAYGFDGGGYTGDLPRVGGVDGKGGFMAVLHPQETVIDHTKPSRNGGATAGGGITIGQMSFPGITNASEARVATATAAKQLGRLINGAGRYA